MDLSEMRRLVGSLLLPGDESLLLPRDEGLLLTGDERLLLRISLTVPLPLPLLAVRRVPALLSVSAIPAVRLLLTIPAILLLRVPLATLPLALLALTGNERVGARSERGRAGVKVAGPRVHF